MNVQSSKAPKENQSGFTLMELLVVLVITSMTTSLLVTGLTATWSNFDRLSDKNLILSQGQLPKKWFIDSVNAAVLTHPNVSMFNGSAYKFEFTTFLAPHDALSRPQVINWLLTRKQNGISLSYTYYTNGEKVAVDIWRFEGSENASFEYLVGGNWIESFNPKNGSIPKAIRIVTDSKEWVLASVHRPTEAEVPPEMSLFGKYEF